MENNDNLIRVYTGSEVSIILLKEALEENGIPTMTRNDYDAGLSAGFVGGTPSTLDLFIQKSDIGKAEPIIKEFEKSN
jgi:hypothetical protein